MKYASIDIETTGLNPATCQVIEIGIVLDDLKNPLPIEKLPRFQSYIVHNGYHGEPTALAMHQKIFDRIAKREAGYRYLAPNELSWCLRNFFADNKFTSGFYSPDAINVAGKNFASFDKPFLEKLGMMEYVKIAHRVIDPAILYYDLAKDDKLPDTKTCMQRAGLTPFQMLGKPLSHDAIGDAIDVVRLLRKKFE